jgi:hypothetical protein
MTRSTAAGAALPDSSMLDTGLGRRGTAGLGSGADQAEPMGGTKQIAEGVKRVSWASSGTRTSTGGRSGRVDSDILTPRTDRSTTGPPLSAIPLSATTSPSAPPSPPARLRTPGNEPRVRFAPLAVAGVPGTDPEPDIDSVMFADKLDRRECCGDALGCTVSSSTLSPPLILSSRKKKILSSSRLRARRPLCPNPDRNQGSPTWPRPPATFDARLLTHITATHVTSSLIICAIAPRFLSGQGQDIFVHSSVSLKRLSVYAMNLVYPSRLSTRKSSRSSSHVSWTVILVHRRSSTNTIQNVALVPCSHCAISLLH